MKYYKRAVLFLGLMLCACLCGAGVSLRLCQESRQALKEAELSLRLARAAMLARSELLTRRQKEIPPVLAFLAAWKPHLDQLASLDDPGLHMRLSLEALAQQKLSLVTDQATVPEPLRRAGLNGVEKLQRVSLRVSGESLEALLVWLGEAGQTFPYARVETVEIAPSGLAGCSLKTELSVRLPGEKGGAK